jgi:hypothetical protein
VALLDGSGGGRSLDLADHIEETRAAGGTGLVWHAGDAISPPFMDDVLTQQGFEKTEDLDVLAFELGTDPELKLPDLRVPNDVSTRLVRGEEDLRLVKVVEAGVIPASTWGEADTRAYMRLHARALGTRRPPAEASGRRGRRVRLLVSGPRSEPPRRRTGGRGYRGRGVDR